jgi:flagellar L-ring protein precursor FlgH
MRRAVITATVLILPTLSACTSLDEAVNGPRLGPMAYPQPLVAQVQPTFASVRVPPPQPSSPNSLWRSGAREFFADQRASRVGDILTVLISIADNAKTQNTTNTGRTSSNDFGVPNFFGLQTSLGKILPPTYDPSHMITTDSSSTTNGTGGVNRSEQINLTIAAVVTQVLPNGNMVIQGTQEVQTNGEVRHLSVSGVVRPEDITSSNTINHTQIAEARISYGGRGDISSVQRTPPGTGVLQRFVPF